MKFFVPHQTSRFAPCRDKECGHDACKQMREIAKSPCTICRKVIGWGVYIVDERSEDQRDRNDYYVGFTHHACRVAWNKKFRPVHHRHSGPSSHLLKPPLVGTDIHIDHPDEREPE